MTDPVGRLPDGSEYLRYIPPLPLDARWQLPEDTGGLRAAWLALRTALSEAGRLDAAMRTLVEHWASRGLLVRPIQVSGRSHIAMMLEIGIDAAVAASAEVSTDLSKWPTEAGRRQSADLLVGVIKQGVDIAPAEVAQLHALLCPTLRPPAVPGMVQDPEVLRDSRGKWRRHMVLVIDGEGVRKDTAPVDRVLPSIAEAIRANAAARAAGVPALVRAAWVLHALGVIHPFYDGNGRLARTLASAVMIRAGGFPLMLPPTAHPTYLHCVSTARKGDPAPLVQLFANAQRLVVRDAVEFLSRGVP
ncbi:MAG TPA: Fic family protein [Phycisphaerales bacterium]|nr:Fic family protein [Phycisphaerales bacterium]